MIRHSFSRRLRVRRRCDYVRVQSSGYRFHTPFFLVFVTRERNIINEGSTEVAPSVCPAKLGITVTKKVGGAVVRNRIKRLVREVFRRERTLLNDGLEIVWVAKRNCAKVTYQQVVDSFRTLCRRTMIGKPDPSAGLQPSLEGAS